MFQVRVANIGGRLQGPLVRGRVFDFESLKGFLHELHAIVSSSRSRVCFIGTWLKTAPTTTAAIFGSSMFFRILCSRKLMNHHPAPSTSYLLVPQFLLFQFLPAGASKLLGRSN